MVALNNSVRMIMLQFSFSNIKIVPPWISELETEHCGEREERKNCEGKGKMVISEIENCSLEKFVSDLKKAGYNLMDASYQKRLDPKDSQKRRVYHMVRFIFVRREYIDFSETKTFDEMLRDKIFKELQKICVQAMWRVRGFINPFFQNNQAVPKYSALSINMEAREPLTQSNGQPVVVWQKDDSNSRISDKPFPIKPSHYLYITDNTIQLSQFVI